MNAPRLLTPSAIAVLVLAGCGSAGPPPTRPPDGRIAVVMSRPGAPESGVYVMHADGSGQTRLTNGAGPGLSWSPDGQRLAFSRGPGITVMNADGSSVTQLTSHGENPAWSPDGHRIAFTVMPNIDLRPGATQDEKSILALKEVDIEVMNADGSGVTRLTSGWSDQSPVWLPDGHRIAFVRNPLGGASGTDCQGTCVINVDGSGLAPLPGPWGDLAWSPDGSMIASVSSSIEGSLSGIYVMSADGSDPTNLTPSLAGNFAYPAWSPNGRKIAFVYRRGVTDVYGTTHYGAFEVLYVMNADGSGLTRLVDGAGSFGGLSWR